MRALHSPLNGCTRFQTIASIALLCLAAWGCSDDNPGGAGTVICGTFGQACTGRAGCCSGICGANSTCAANPTLCSPTGSSCAANTDCCTISCVGGFCSGTQCVQDNQGCTSDAACCGGKCTSGTCTALNPTCRSSGNPCTASTDCCSSYCDGSFCRNSSFCVQTGDACARDADCCGGICNLAGGSVGKCAAPPTGATNCTGVDGTVCSDCGSCCSRLCAPYGPTGVHVCQPAEGCRINGDLCRQTSDCCGAAGTGLPGDGNVTCQKASPTDTVGICRNPMSCNPEGNVCHYMNYMSCGNSSARNDCCAAVGNSGVCQLDAIGIPRCYGLGTACRNAGETCAYSGDCCGGVPCIPDMNGALHCSTPAPDGGVACSPSGGACTTSADCCVGYTCASPVGSLQGTCTTSTGYDGGVCSQYGQACSESQACCNGVMCRVTSSGTACPMGQSTGCTCFDLVQ